MGEENPRLIAIVLGIYAIAGVCSVLLFLNSLA